MADVKLDRAQRAYETLCKCLDDRNWTYEKAEDELLVHFKVNGEDLPIQLIIWVDTERQLVRLGSHLPFEMSEERRIDGAIATCHATYGLTEGSFDYDVSTGRIAFRITVAFHDNDVSEGMIQYMIDFTCVAVDKYNDKFFALNKGFLTIEKFLED